MPSGICGVIVPEATRKAKLAANAVDNWPIQGSDRMCQGVVGRANFGPCPMALSKHSSREISIDAPVSMTQAAPVHSLMLAAIHSRASSMKCEHSIVPRSICRRSTFQNNFLDLALIARYMKHPSHYTIKFIENWRITICSTILHNENACGEPLQIFVNQINPSLKKIVHGILETFLARDALKA